MGRRDGDEAEAEPHYVHRARINFNLNYKADKTQGKGKASKLPI